MGAPAARVSELARHLIGLGHQVTVLTAFPNHPNGVVPPEYSAKFRRCVYREWLDGIHVVRTWLVPLPNRKPHERILNYTSFCLSSCLVGIFLHRADVIIATSPQLLVGLTGWWLGRSKSIPWILEVRDLWPDSITASGVGKQASFLTRSLRALSGFLYHSCDHVVVVTPAFKDELITKWKVYSEKISVVENGVETDLFMPHGDTDEVKSAMGLNGRFVVSCIGTLGLAHGLSIVLQVAAQLRNGFPEILFLFVGEGADKKRLIEASRYQGLDNIRFQPQQPRENIPAIIRASDLCLVLLKKADVFKTVIPTKMLEFMACGRPVILGVDGQAHQLIEKAQAGVFIEPENPEALIKALIRLYHDADLRETLGHNGRQYILDHLSREQTAKVYTSVLEKLVSKWKKKHM
jgi:glycosyltransferase involved in cell wall biosynthesis